MRRGATGTYVLTTVTGDEPIRAFVPAPLPPEPPLAIAPDLRERLDLAQHALGRLDGVSTLLPDTHLFLYAYLRKEAVLSSQIEGTQSSLSDLLLFEASEAPGVPLDDVVEVSSYVAAMQHGLNRVRDLPLSGRLLREIHAILLQRGRGAERQPGEFRRSQNWIGGSRPANASFVPPPPERVAACMSDLERWLNDIPERTPTILKAALGHVQFETIHPFLDGNGRLGRLLVTLLLCGERLLTEPLLYLSLYLKQHRSEYYALLDRVRSEGDWEAWVSFFADGVRETAAGAVSTAQRIVQLFQEDRARMGGLRRTAGSVMRVHEALQRHPIGSARSLSISAGLSIPTVLKTLDALQRVGVVRETTGRRRDRLYRYDAYLRILDEGTEPL
jgi:Fic family protein